MRKMTCLLLFAVLFALGTTKAQTIIKGVVHDQVSKETIPAVSITVEGKKEGDYTDDKGRFHTDARSAGMVGRRLRNG